MTDINQSFKSNWEIWIVSLRGITLLSVMNYYL